jgi:hypothetical protein
MARPLTVFSLLRGRRSALPVGELIQEGLLRFGRTRSPTTIRRMSFIHFARLTVIHRLPRLGQPEEEDIRHPLMLFLSVYDGTFSQYIETFAAGIPIKMRAFWGTSYGYPGIDPVTPFKQYIRDNEFSSGHTYLANGEATTTMIRAALKLRDPHEAFYRSTVQCADGAEFRDLYAAFLTEVQEHL